MLRRTDGCFHILIFRDWAGSESLFRRGPVFAIADNNYAELCIVKATALAKIPKGLDLIQAAALPLVTVTRNQLLAVTRSANHLAIVEETMSFVGN